jgi:ribosomal protein S27E
MPEYLYLASNQSMPGLVKIGRTTTSPVQRMSELHSTGVPTPFELEFVAVVPNCTYAEQRAHSALRAYRVSRGREFFRCSVEEAVRSIIGAIGQFEVDWKHTRRHPDIEELADRLRKEQARVERERMEERLRRDAEKQRRDHAAKMASMLEERAAYKRAAADYSVSNKQWFRASQAYVFKRVLAVALAIGTAIYMETYKDASDAFWFFVAGFAYYAFVVAHPGKKPEEPRRPAHIAQEMARDDRVHIKCKGCSTTLRVPANKSLKVTCPRCQTVFFSQT